MADFMNAVNGNSSIEHGFTILKMDGTQGVGNLNVNGGYLGDPNGVQTGTTSQVAINEHTYMAATIHNHPSTGSPTPSALDLIVTVYQAVQYPKFEGSFISAANGDMYCIKVTMTDAQRAALKSQGFDTNYSTFKSTTINSANGFVAGTDASDYYSCTNTPAPWGWRIL